MKSSEPEVSLPGTKPNNGDHAITFTLKTNHNKLKSHMFKPNR